MPIQKTVITRLYTVITRRHRKILNAATKFMCLLLFYLNPEAKEDEYYLILINVRDEIYDRPTQQAHFWKNHPDVIGGVDNTPGKEGGTWFAASKTGKIAALLNVLQPDEDLAENRKGRGFLVVNYVASNEDSLQYLNNIQQEKDEYNGFTLVTMDFSSFRKPKVAYYSNMSSSPPTVLEPGIHAFGNSTSADYPWPKVIEAKKQFSELVKRHSTIQSKKALMIELFDFIRDPTRYKLDENMKRQGKGKSESFMDQLSSIFIDMTDYNYGSRCHTIVLISGSGQVSYYERSRSQKPPIEWIFLPYTYDLILENTL